MKAFSIVSTSLLAGFTLFIASSQMTAQTAAAPAESLELRKIMITLGQDMLSVVDGINREDWQQVEQAAMRIADHPGPPPAEKARIVAFMGSDMAKFKNFDDNTHNTARELAEIAAEKNGYGVIATFSRLQSTCLACHQSFRQSFQQHFYGRQQINY